MINPARWMAIKIMKRRRRKALLGLRRELATWGIRTDHLNDDELLEGCSRFGMLASSVGINRDRAAVAFRKTKVK